MNSVVICGNESQRNQYIEEFISGHSIKSFNVHRYENGLKIADSREIKKILSRSLSQGERRLIIISGYISQEAQNALLKSVEELPANTYLIFSIESKDNLLPTILSRCTVLPGFFSSSPADIDPNFYPAIENFLRYPVSSESILYCSEILNISTIAAYTQFIYCVRELLLASGNSAHIKKLAFILEKLLENYSFVAVNNISARYIIENILYSFIA